MMAGPLCLEPIQDLYDRGLYLQAYRIALEHGDPRSWRGAEARVLAGRLCHNLGGNRLGTTIHMLGGREHPDHPRCVYYHARALSDTRGPLDAWRFLERCGVPAGSDLEVQVDLASLRAFILGRLRDFESADREMQRARDMASEHPWTYVEMSCLLEIEDRFDDALAAARHALEIRPWFRPAVAIAAHLLQIVGNDRGALDLLQQGNSVLESGHLVLQLADLQQELGLHGEARENLEKLPALLPLLDSRATSWLAGRRADAAYHCGDIEETLRLAAEAKTPYSEALRANILAAPPDARRVLLDVGFVRQHHVTCGPATLTAISRFWNMPADHLEVAGEICYDGTSHVSERRWAMEHGWVARDFRVTWESAVALIDRGIPFTLTVIEPSFSHLQAVVGHDSKRRTLLIRDPNCREIREALADALLERYRHVGPRGMVMVPAARAELLDGLDLPDAALHDRYHEIEQAIRHHDRAKARAVCDEMEANAPDHPLVIEARLLLATYDADPLSELACLDRIVARFPGGNNWLLMRGYRLLRLGRRREFLEALRPWAEKPAADPAILDQYVQLLRDDARLRSSALQTIRRSIRVARDRAPSYYILGNLLWDLRRFEEALEAYRFAACLDDKDEQLASSYFTACRFFKRTAEALEFLASRFERFHHKSSGPIRTLFHALAAVDRVADAFARLEEALRLRPEDGDLLLFAADAHARHGRYTEADHLVERARGRCRRADWLRVAARLAFGRGDLRRSLDLWREVLETEPVAVDAHRAVADRLEETEGRAAAIAHLRAAVARFDHNRELQEALVERMRTEDAPAREAVIRRLLDADPINAWARRELALALARDRRCDEALAEVEKAAQLEPGVPPLHNVRGIVLRLAGKREEAAEEFREALRLSVDEDFAIHQLVDLAETADDRRAALRFVKEEMTRQVVFGAGLLAFLQESRATLDPEDALATVREALDARPDLWEAWSVVAQQLCAMGRASEAHGVILQATDRFPLHPRVWLDLAEVCRQLLDRDGEVRALEQARALQPGYGPAVRGLVEVYDREGRFEECRKLMEQAVARDPVDPAHHGYLADALWKLGEKDAAVRALERAVTLDPAYEWAWGRLREWSREAGRADLVAEMARDLAKRRSGEVRSWMILSRALGPSDPEGALQALARAEELEPRNVEIHDTRAWFLAEAGRYEDAIRACFPPVWGEHPPVYLLGRAAWVEARRGRLLLAVSRMRDAVRIDSTYLWGWSQLAEWCDTLDDLQGLEESAESLLRLDGRNPLYLACLGRARDRKGDRNGAKEALARAAALAPDYRYAVDLLLDMRLADGEIGESETLLARSEPHMTRADVLARRVQILAGKGKPQDAEAVFRELLLEEDAELGALSMAGNALDAVLSGAVARVVREVASKPGVSRALGPFLLGRVEGRGGWSRRRKILDLFAVGSPAWCSAARAYLECAGRQRRRPAILKLISECRGVLESDPILWGTTAYALNGVDDHGRCVQWCAGWEERSGVEAWMLENLAHSLRWRGRDADGAAVDRYALALPSDGSRSMHEVWLLFDDALAGRQREALERHGRVDRSCLADLHRLLLLLAEALLQRHGEDGGPKAARAAISKLLGGEPAFRKDRLLRRLARRSVLVLARSTGGFRAWVWALPWLARL